MTESSQERAKVAIFVVLRIEPFVISAEIAGGADERRQRLSIYVSKLSRFMPPSFPRSIKFAHFAEDKRKMIS